MKRFIASLLFLMPGAVFAQACEDQTHRVQDGETIFSIAERYYGNQERWSLIFYGNQRVLSGSVFDVAPGIDLNIPCLPGQIVADARPLEQMTQKCAWSQAATIPPSPTAIGPVTV